VDARERGCDREQDDSVGPLTHSLLTVCTLSVNAQSCGKRPRGSARTGVGPICSTASSPSPGRTAHPGPPRASKRGPAAAPADVAGSLRPSLRNGGGLVDAPGRGLVGAKGEYPLGVPYLPCSDGYKVPGMSHVTSRPGNGFLPSPYICVQPVRSNFPKRHVWCGAALDGWIAASTPDASFRLVVVTTVLPSVAGAAAAPQAVSSPGAGTSARGKASGHRQACRLLRFCLAPRELEW